MTESIHVSTLLRELFSEFESEGVSYLVLRNYENLPEFTENDVDLLINPAQLNEAVQCLEKVALATCWTIHNVGEFSCWTFFLYHQKTLAQVHLDFMCGIKWHSAFFADHHSLLTERCRFKCFYVPSQEHEAAINLLTRLLYCGYVRKKYRDGIAETAMRVPEKLVGVLSPWIGNKLAWQFVETSKKEDWERIERATGTARARVIVANLRKPLFFFSRVLSDCGRLIRRLLDSPGFSLVLVGSDDVKTTCIAEGIVKALPGTFSPERTRHLCWAPAQVGEKRDGEAFSALSSLRRNLTSSFVVSLSWVMKFNYRWFRQVKPIVFRNGFVVLERYGYDFFLNSTRYGLDVPSCLSQFCMYLIPKADLVVYLDASEVGSADDGREYALFRSTIEKRRKGRVINASQDSEVIVEELRGVVFSYMAARAKRRLKRFK